MSEMSVEAVIPPTRRERARKLVAKIRKQVEIRSLQVAEKVVRARTLRLMALEAVGALVVFHGIDLYSSRVAFILLGAGVIFAVERQ